MVKVSGGARYYYYGLEQVIPLKFRRLVEQAKRKLCETKILFQVNKKPIPCIPPYNVLKIKNHAVSFLWYENFWSDKRPRLVYSIKVNLKDSSIRVFRGRKTFSTEWPWSYIHRKELFIWGLEELVLNPYGNMKTLVWDRKRKKDIWIDLPYQFFKFYTETDENGYIIIKLPNVHRNRKVEVLLRVFRD